GRATTRPSAASAPPAPLTSLVGVEPTLAQLGALLLQREVRLLSLLGPGGIGKTRLAIELARRVATAFADGAHFVDLTVLRDPATVAVTIGRTLEVQLGDGVDPDTQIKAHLRDQELLLVLDNFEHLLAAAPLVAALLSAAPRLKILVTSRAALHVYGEHEWVVAPLAVPDPASAHVESAAIELFVQRARAANSGFALTSDNTATIAELCVWMEGLPLAIELAAAQSKFFSPQAMLVRLAHAQRLRFLDHGPQHLPARQQTLRGMLEWSYRLLPPELQSLFRLLAVFVGGCTVEAVFAVGARIDGAKFGNSDQVQAGLIALADQSLLHQRLEPSGEPRFQTLETTREYAQEQLDLHAETSAAQRAHARHYLHWAEHGQAAPADSLETQAALLKREYANCQAAIAWAVEQREDEISLRFVAALWEFWTYYGHHSEGWRIAQSVIKQTVGRRDALRAHLFRLVGWLAHDLRDFTTMQPAFQSSFDISQALDDQQGIGLALHGLGSLARLRGQWQVAQSQLQRSLAIFQLLGDQEGHAWSLDHLGRLALSQGECSRAQSLFQTSHALFRSFSSRWGPIFTYGHQGRAAFYQGDLEAAGRWFSECSFAARASGAQRSPMAALTLNYLGAIAMEQGQSAQAHVLLAECLALSSDHGYVWCLETANFVLGRLAVGAGQPDVAVAHFKASLVLQQSLREPWRALLTLEACADLLLARSEVLAAARLCGAAEHLRSVCQVRQPPIYQSAYAATRQQLQIQLSPASLAETMLAGQTLTLEQAITYALRCLET
ncbi:MAG: tetratricopeptide repeat protein, partial [Herpetosiphonaceae bacterium]|nr:tetratricopeptide repeat protein [Herpetosiphonaceae bacterium]